MINGDSVRGIFFDAGWTLFRPRNADWFINLKVEEYVCLEKWAAIPILRRKAVFDKALQYLDEHHRLFTEKEELEQFRIFYSLIFQELPEFQISQEQIDCMAYSKVFDMDNYIQFQDTKPTLDALKGRYKMGIISDTWPSIERILHHGGIDSYFACKTYSCFLGVCKPDRRIYIHALEQMCLPPEQTIFIDDDEENLAGAAACGIHPILITANPRTKNSGRYISISSLSELLHILPG